MWENFKMIATKPDNVPIIFMLVLVIFFIGWGVKEGRRNDKLIDDGKRDDVAKDMQR